MKEITQIALNITEQEYRNLNCISQSMLTRYMQEGAKYIDKIDEPLESQSLTFGSVVDKMITEPQRFDDCFMVMPNASKDTIEYMTALSDTFGDKYQHLLNIPAEELSAKLKELGFYPADKWSVEKRVSDFMAKHNPDIYNVIATNRNKTFITAEMFEEAKRCNETLRENKATKYYLEKDDIMSQKKRYFQLKFATEINGVHYKCMLDEVIVDYENKTIEPIDYKTSSNYEYEFPVSFIKYKYYIQARLYSRILKVILSKDEDFKDFEILPFKFIVINKETLSPLVWAFPNTEPGSIRIPTDKYVIILEDPEFIAEELDYLLQNKRNIPAYIDNEAVNDICDGIRFQYRQFE